MRIMLIAVLIWLAALSAIADTLRVEWDYGGAADYFILYRNGAPWAKLQSSPAEIANVTVGLFDVFTMTAVGLGGETPHSASFVMLTAASVDWTKTAKIKSENHHGRLSGTAPVALQ